MKEIKKETLEALISLKEEISLLVQENKDLIIKNENLQQKNNSLQDEVDSLWAMMDEITKSDIENFSHILDELKADVITRSLMVTKKVAEA
jgi:FtsZ-binding cell division protein ZapB